MHVFYYRRLLPVPGSVVLGTQLRRFPIPVLTSTYACILHRRIFCSWLCCVMPTKYTNRAPENTLLLSVLHIKYTNCITENTIALCTCIQNILTASQKTQMHFYCDICAVVVIVLDQ